MPKSPLVARLCCHLSLGKNVTFITFLSCNQNLQQDYLFRSMFIRSFPPFLTYSFHHHKGGKREFLPFIRLYKDGSVERLVGSPYVPPSWSTSMAEAFALSLSSPSIINGTSIVWLLKLKLLLYQLSIG